MKRAVSRRINPDQRQQQTNYYIAADDVLLQDESIKSAADETESEFSSSFPSSSRFLHSGAK